MIFVHTNSFKLNDGVLIDFLINSSVEIKLCMKIWKVVEELYQINV